MLSDEVFLQHYDELKHKVFSYFYYRLNYDTQLAEDLTSDTFCKAFAKKNHYDSDFAFSTWIFTIARNHLTDYFRKNKQKEIDLLDDAVEDLAEDETELFWKKSIDQKIFKNKFQEALLHLNETQKDVILLKYLEDRTNQEVAEILDLTVANVRQNHCRGIKKLKPLLQKFIEFSTLLLLFFS